MTWPSMSEGAEAALTRAGGRCERCGQPAGHSMLTKLVVHHKAGRAFPACNHPDLLAVLCDQCHRHVHAYPTTSYLAGWLVHRNGVELANIIAALEPT